MGDVVGSFFGEGQGVARATADVGWRAQLEQVHSALTSCAQQIAREVKLQTTAEITGNLNRSARRLRSANEESWREVLLEAVQGFCGRAALFMVQNETLRLHGVRGIRTASPFRDVPAAAAPAFRAAVVSGDTIVAMRTKGEMSEAIAAAFGEAHDSRFHLFPISARGQVAALIYADGDAVQVDALDLLACIAGAVLEARPPRSQKNEQLIHIASARKQPAEQEWLQLSDHERELHRKAQRFGRVQVASLRLYKSDDVKTGRAEGTLYRSLKDEIDAARGVFHRDFISKSATMVDYLHLELVRTLANENVELLGPDYPGPMV